jgi:hypothetical protein
MQNVFLHQIQMLKEQKCGNAKNKNKKRQRKKNN